MQRLPVALAGWLSESLAGWIEASGRLPWGEIRLRPSKARPVLRQSCHQSSRQRFRQSRLHPVHFRLDSDDVWARRD